MPENSVPGHRGPVVILSGSLREAPVSEAVGRAIDGVLSELGIETHHVTVRDLDLPFFNPDVHRGDRTLIQPFLDLLQPARAMVWVAPAYHRTMSGSFKNALDFIEVLANDDPPYLKGKGIGMVAVAGGMPATMSTITSMEFTAHALRAYVIPYSVPIPFAGRLLDENGGIANDDIAERLTLLCGEVESFLRSYSPGVVRPNGIETDRSVP